MATTNHTTDTHADKLLKVHRLLATTHSPQQQSEVLVQLLTKQPDFYLSSKLQRSMSLSRLISDVVEEGFMLKQYNVTQSMRTFL